jgi:1-acyl-sn-glycerol-3-phosphate acyltransferase
MGTRPSPEEVAIYREKIISEICYALGIGRSGALRRLLGPLFRQPADRVGRIAARGDSEVVSSGISGGARRILPDFSLTVSARGTEWIPPDGPLLLFSNHPGALDSVALLSCIQRKDIKVLISDVPFTRAFRVARQYFIYVSHESSDRRTALRESIDHLRGGGSLLIFPHGDVEPDPEVTPGAAESIEHWSRSIEIMLRRVPESWFQAAIASGVLSRKFVRSPLVKIRKDPARRQKLAEVLQLGRQAVSPGSVPTHVHVSFAKPAKGLNIIGDELMPALIKIARKLLEEHLESWKISDRSKGPLKVSSDHSFRVK